MWKIAENVYRVPFRDSMISESDEKEITFPLHVDINDIYLKNTNNTIIHINDDSMIGVYDKHASKGDRIVISFIPRLNHNISVNLIMEDIYRFSCTNINYGTTRFDGVKINITTGGETPSYKPQAKYSISMPWVEIIGVEANIVYLSEAKYINQNS